MTFSGNSAHVWRTGNIFRAMDLVVPVAPVTVALAAAIPRVVEDMQPCRARSSLLQEAIKRCELHSLQHGVCCLRPVAGGDRSCMLVKGAKLVHRSSRRQLHLLQLRFSCYRVQQHGLRTVRCRLPRLSPPLPGPLHPSPHHRHCRNHVQDHERHHAQEDAPSSWSGPPTAARPLCHGRRVEEVRRDCRRNREGGEGEEARAGRARKERKDRKEE
eukprot:116562-Hanusia_phi.AAC.1